MLLSHPPPPRLLPTAAPPRPGSSSSATAAPFILILRRRQRRRHRHRRPYHHPVPRASLSDILASLPSSLALVGPAAAAAVAAVAASFSSGSSSYVRNSLPPPSSTDYSDSDYGACGEWILFTSPTPFNRSVLLRCPSVSFDDGGVLLDGVNERLLTEERHYVNLSRGRIPAARGGGDGAGDGEVSYQRVCIPTEDGGVIALDWPDNLDLDKEHGLDSTVFIVPGTPEGSMERGIKLFVLDALKNGYFPIVMNPRGCGGSPLTSPRLFTAADSDDICTAIQFVNNKRPWTTLMGVGWGFGANMLTKYLVEVGESTPLTAGVCVDNPFDLEEATRSFPHHIALDQKVTAGLVDILRANKELFQGKDKDFNVQKALSSNCLRDFDGAISMVSHGFSTVDDFYSKSSTRLSITHSDDGTVPLLSVPRSSISENPFTSLLLCSCVHSAIFTFERYAVLWCQNLALEWLSAVEFALLKGRHPLIKDVDITVNPSKGLSFVEPQANNRKVPNKNNFHQQSQFILYNSMPHGINGLLLDSAKEHSGSNKKENIQVKDNGEIDRARKDIHEEEPEETPEDDEKGHVLQSASLVMNMLDATMPGTLDDDQKKKVLVAVEQGESLVKALEEAVPEDVRGKLTTSVTEILQSKQGNFSLDALRRLGWTNGRPNTKAAVQEKVKDSDRENGTKDARMHDQNKNASAVGDVDQKDGNLTSNDGTSGEGIELSQGKPSQTSGPVGVVTEMGTEQIQPNRSEKTISGINESSEEQHKTDQGTETASKQVSDDQSPGEKKVSDDQSSGEKKLSDDQSTPNLNAAPRERVQSAETTAESPQAHVVEKDGDAVRSNEDKATHNVTDQSMQVSKTEESKPPPVNVTQALDALTGFDDSTQMAVNSVFGVLENMIDQFEKQHESENGDKSDGSTDDVKSDGSSEEASVNKTKSQVTGDMDNESNGNAVNPSSNQAENNIPGKDHSIMSDDHTIGQTNEKLSIISSAKGKLGNYQRNITENYVDADAAKQGSGMPDYLLDIAVNSYLKAQYAMYLHEFLSTQLQLKAPDSNSATDLYLDPHEGKWKIADHMDSVHDNNSKSDKGSSFAETIDLSGSSQEPNRTGNVIDTPYLVLSNFPVSRDKSNESKNTVATKLPDIALREALTSFIRDELENALKIEVGRKVGITNTEQLERNLAHDVERLAAQVSRAVVLDCVLFSAACVQRNPTTVKFGTTHGENVIEAVSNAVQQSHDLRNILPMGVIVGVTLASLRNYFDVGISKHNKHTKTTVKSGILNEDPDFKNASFKKEKSMDNISSHKEENANNASSQKEENANDTSSKKQENADDFIKKTGQKVQEMTRSEGQGMMVGAVTAALGASAFVAHHQQNKVEKHMDGTTASDQHRSDENAQEKSQNNLMTSLAEKAMSVASPVVPTKGDGEVDHERLVAVLAELGQKGGALKFVGKIALLWGGMRGAMSLTDRLISFLRISERPLFQRIMGFSLMVLLLWSPVVIPLLPTLVQSWTINSSTGVVGYACIVGLYVSIMILVILWGKRIRGYENPVEQYGMNLASASRVQEFFQGLVGGITVVGLVHSVSIFLGFATFRGSYSLLARPFDLLKSSSNVLLLALRGFVTATSIAVVEEVVFRSWLPEEIAVDLGYYSAILISGVAFSLIHRSLPSVPGFLLLSLILFGLKQRTQGKLAAPIGLRSGIMTASYLIQTSGIIQSKPGTPFWMVSTYHLHPFDGVIGLSICALFAILLFPQEPVQKDTFVS
uniref:AB hydrolase-1 domain-containing protein n=1 Tax=Leersia perrieri TaxID=77586 RepID=A0A0D9XE27_9ORYZ